MTSARDALTPASLAMLEAIAEHGSFAAAARALGMVPSALTYRVRVIEEALDALLFDRSSRRARLTEAGAELLREGARLLDDIDAIANRVQRVATGWESHFTVAVDSVIDRATVMELCAAFFALDAPTRLKLRGETLSGTLEAVSSGQADLAIGVVLDTAHRVGLQRETLGALEFVFVVSPGHPLAAAPEPLGEDAVRAHRAVVLADSVGRGGGLSVGTLAGQEVFTVTEVQAKVDAHLRGLGVGYLPLPVARPYLEAGALVAKRLARPEHRLTFYCVWRSGEQPAQGKALQWWLEQVRSPVTRAALLGERRSGRTFK
ncbi:LysR family transcriptional regulator [Massilia sp. KIM]|uniref:LysR family transcriptional regulator n=1 Tax=Massilia sp. KIM TaxID=1955422 RepID=UPI00098FF8B6|nr:LysR family transcriptional regulator [Massilia sp. KIM]OON62407.1 LysR family transcriptional regulator [Massilia sp. KIM]